MFFRTFFLCLVGFLLVKSAEQNPLEITFVITTKAVENKTTIICDHNNDDTNKKMYTVREGEELTIIPKYKPIINYIFCGTNNNQNENFNVKNQQKGSSKNVTYTVAKTMGTVWNCTVLAHKDTSGILPVVSHNNKNYAAAYCYMNIHVRQTNSPQTILVNNVVLQAVRTDLSEKDVDFTAEYQYADGDVVTVTCINFLEEATLKMEYEMAGTKSDNSTMDNLSSSKAISFRVTLHSGHNNSYMICTKWEPTDYTKVMVRFIRKEFKNIVSITINGMTLRPELLDVDNDQYKIEYKYLSNQPIKVVCEVQRTDMKLVVVDALDFAGKVSSYRKKVIIPDKKSEMSFYLNTKDEKKFRCSADNTLGGRSEEHVIITFTEGNFPIDQYPLHMELPSIGTVMELYNENKLNVIYYEFKDGETLQLNCGSLPMLPIPGPALYLQMKHKNSPIGSCNVKGCNVTNKLTHVTRQEYDNTSIVCYLKEKEEDNGTPHEEGDVLREIRVILSERVPTTTSTTTTTTSTTTNPIEETSHASNHNDASSVHGDKENNENPAVGWRTIGVIAAAALCIIIICVSIVIVKLRKRNHSQGGPHNRNYENLQSPSETSIPAYPPQWESNYAVPVDRRTEDPTYSVPCQEQALYSTPTPKNLRNKNQKPVDPTYAILDVPNARGQKNAFKETEDPNYSEVYANRQEQCYAKVLPKSVRNKMVQDNNPYSYVTNEPAYANTTEPEPMYCEPAKAQGGTYANLNNAHYANSNAQEYVEPTYCEPQKLMK